ncbi:hypothetical protein BDR05DRAFT_947113 [Suillus weaverae]|nr:hypothetical protein BDR05DRAFT_947113 [Suillus weaverae]
MTLTVPLMTESDLSVVCDRYLGVNTKKNKICKMNDQKFIFDWNMEEDMILLDFSIAAQGIAETGSRKTAAFTVGNGTRHLHHICGVGDLSLPHLTTLKINSLNQAFFAWLAAQSDIAIMQMDLNGVFCVRMAIGTEKTVEKDVDMALDVIGQEGQATLRKWERMWGL